MLVNATGWLDTRAGRPGELSLQTATGGSSRARFGAVHHLVRGRIGGMAKPGLEPAVSGIT
jgi:hypothetical protein